MADNKKVKEATKILTLMRKFFQDMERILGNIDEVYNETLEVMEEGGEK